MNTQLTACICGVLLLLATLSVQSNSSHEAPQWGAVTFANDYRIDVEIADTEALRALGLMHRDELAENKGMLFVYPDQAVRGVWMKNTRLALDVLFLSGNGKIVSMLRNLPPCKQEPCPISISSATAQYMLEVNADFIDKHHLEIGQDVIIDYSHAAQ